MLSQNNNGRFAGRSSGFPHSWGGGGGGFGHAHPCLRRFQEVESDCAPLAPADAIGAECLLWSIWVPVTKVSRNFQPFSPPQSLSDFGQRPHSFQLLGRKQGDSHFPTSGSHEI